MSGKDVSQLKQDLKESMGENAHLADEVSRLRDQVDSLEASSSVSEKELQHLRTIASVSLAVRDLLCSSDYQVAVTRLSSALSNAQGENLL